MVRKDRKKIVAELHHNKQEGNEYPVILGENVPVIKELKWFIRLFRRLDRFARIPIRLLFFTIVK